jgi:5-methylcytosine-specific restriction enzyme subunit McrC
MIPRVIELTEYQTRSFARGELDEETARALHSNFGSQVCVEAPTFLNGNTWNLTAQGWVGYIPLTPEVHFSLAPKVPIHNLFGMLEYAYRLKGFKILKGLADSASIAELYDNLALILAKRILDRIKKGLYRSYLSQDDHLPYVRGRMDVLAHARDPVRVALPCHFEDQTSDLEDNQILLWTLTRVLQCGFCTDRTLPYVRKAHRTLQGFATTTPFAPSQCVDRLYSRLNEDYEPMHALCRFFLEHIGPTYQVGDRRMLPVLVDMEKLFEVFVVEWMKQHVSDRYTVRGQETIQMQIGQPVLIKLDIVVDDLLSGQTALVLDTKYKNPDQVALTDIHQVVSYAEAKHCRKAVLVYPAPSSKPIDGPWGANIYVKSHSFRLDGDLDEAGGDFLKQLSKSSGLALQALPVVEYVH